MQRMKDWFMIRWELWKARRQLSAFECEIVNRGVQKWE